MWRTGEQVKIWYDLKFIGTVPLPTTANENRAPPAFAPSAICQYISDFLCGLAITIAVNAQRAARLGQNMH